jgi:predicted nucleotide-binding protein
LAKINQDLIDRLRDKLGVGQSAVYARIAKVGSETMLDRHHAALLLAAKNGININRYSTPEERADIRAVTGGGARRDTNPHPSPEPAQHHRAASMATKRKPTRRRRSKGKTIFVVHGRDEALRKSIFEFLRALKLDPLEWDEALRRAKGANPYVGDVIDEVMDQAQAVLVMFSPDDLVQLKEQFVGNNERNTEGRQRGQARPNVLFEAGLAMGRHQDKTVLVQVRHVKPFSDIGGRHMLRLDNSPESRRQPT